MRSAMIILTVMALAVLLGSPALTQDIAAAEEAIEMLATQYEEGWKNGDAQTCAAIYAPDADLIDFVGKSYKGRAEIEKSIADVLAMYPGSQIDIQKTAIRFVKPDLAVWDGTWEVTGVPETEGPKPPTKGSNTVVIVKQDGQWLLAYGMSSVPPPSPSTAQN
jgi:uncharacterized protein (TIGR02246 family)